MRTRILGVVAGLALFGAGAAVAKEETKSQKQAQQQQQQEGQQQEGQQQQAADTQDLQPILGVGPQEQVVTSQGEREEDDGSIATGPMMYGNTEAPSDEGINKAPASSAGGYSSASPYAASPSTRGKGSAEVTVEEGQGVGGAGQQAESTLTGTVVKAERSKVFLRTGEGAIVPLKVDRQTQFGDESMKSAKSLQEGQQVRASFQVEKTDNRATRLEVVGGAQGTGGAGAKDGDGKQEDAPQQQ